MTGGDHAALIAFASCAPLAGQKRSITDTAVVEHSTAAAPVAKEGRLQPKRGRHDARQHQALEKALAEHFPQNGWIFPCQVCRRPTAGESPEGKPMCPRCCKSLRLGSARSSMEGSEPQSPSSMYGGGSLQLSPLNLHTSPNSNSTSAAPSQCGLPAAVGQNSCLPAAPTFSQYPSLFMVSNNSTTQLTASPFAASQPLHTQMYASASAGWQTHQHIANPWQQQQYVMAVSWHPQQPHTYPAV